MTENTLEPKTAAVSVRSPPPAFRIIYAQEAQFVWRVVRRLGGRDSELEDLVHDVFAAAWRSWHTLDGARPVRPWLYGVAFRVMLDHHRRHSTHREQPTAELPDLVDERPSPSRTAETRQELSVAQQIIDDLEIERRAVFVLHELEGLDMPEIARALNVPLNTAYSRLRLARRDFEAAAQIRRDHDGP